MDTCLIKYDTQLHPGTRPGTVWPTHRSEPSTKGCYIVTRDTRLLPPVGESNHRSVDSSETPPWRLFWGFRNFFAGPSHLPTLIIQFLIQKTLHSTRATHKSIEVAASSATTQPIFVGREIFYAGEEASSTLQLSSESSCRALQAFVVSFGRKTWVVVPSSDSFVIFFLCFTFALGLGFCWGVEVQKNFWKTEVDWLSFGHSVFWMEGRKSLWRLKHFARFSAKVTFWFEACEIRWGKKGDHSIGVLIIIF